MSFGLILALRLTAATLIGALIGYERELRGKNAGVRTHILVALGASMFMIMSQYGFDGAVKFDAARIAAGVVGGLGFLGGGIILKNKRVSGLTTAAGIWVTGAIGMCFGCGMYEIGLLGTIFVLVCMECLHFYSFKLGETQVSAVLTSKDEKQLNDAITALHKQISWISVTHQEDTHKAEIHLLIKKKKYPDGILTELSSFPGVHLVSLE